MKQNRTTDNLINTSSDEEQLQKLIKYALQDKNMVGLKSSALKLATSIESNQKALSSTESNQKVLYQKALLSDLITTLHKNNSFSEFINEFSNQEIIILTQNIDAKVKSSLAPKNHKKLLSQYFSDTNTPLSKELCFSYPCLIAVETQSKPEQLKALLSDAMHTQDKETLDAIFKSDNILIHRDYGNSIVDMFVDNFEKLLIPHLLTIMHKEKERHPIDYTLSSKIVNIAYQQHNDAEKRNKISNLVEVFFQNNDSKNQTRKKFKFKPFEAIFQQKNKLNEADLEAIKFFSYGSSNLSFNPASFYAASNGKHAIAKQLIKEGYFIARERLNDFYPRDGQPKNNLAQLLNAFPEKWDIYGGGRDYGDRQMFAAIDELDSLRVNVLFASNLSVEEQIEFLNKNRKMSPKMMAIKTNQPELVQYINKQMQDLGYHWVDAQEMGKDQEDSYQKITELLLEAAKEDVKYEKDSSNIEKSYKALERDAKALLTSANQKEFQPFIESLKQDYDNLKNHYKEFAVYEVNDTSDYASFSKSLKICIAKLVEPILNFINSHSKNAEIVKSSASKGFLQRVVEEVKDEELKREQYKQGVQEFSKKVKDDASFVKQFIEERYRDSKQHNK